MRKKLRILRSKALKTSRMKLLRITSGTTSSKKSVRPSKKGKKRTLKPLMNSGLN